MTLRTLPIHALPLSGLLLLMHGNTCEGQNLVPNPSFEDYNYDCGAGITGSNDIFSWTLPDCSLLAGYCNACFVPFGFDYAGTPGNINGFQAPSEGSAYLSILTYSPDLSFEGNPLEFVTVQLWEPLQAGQQYCVRLKASLMDSASYRTGSLHCLLTYDVPSACSDFGQSWAAASAVTLNTQAVDTSGWSLLEGSFTASGGETVLTIGNLRFGADLDTSFIAPLRFPYYAGYYIDEVYLGTCDNSFSETNGNDGLIVFPNPVRSGEVLFIRTPATALSSQCELLDACGRRVRIGSLHGPLEKLSLDDVAPGHYLLRVNHEHGMMGVHIIVE